MNKTEKTLMRAGLLIGLAMLGSVSTAHAGNVQDQADCARVAQKNYDVFFDPTPYAEHKFCNSLNEFMTGIKPYMTE